MATNIMKTAILGSRWRTCTVLNSSLNSKHRERSREKKVIRKRKTSQCDHKHNKNSDIFNVFIHNKKIKINSKNKNTLNVRSVNDLIWKKSLSSERVDIAIIENDKTGGNIYGLLRIEGYINQGSTRGGIAKIPPPEIKNFQNTPPLSFEIFRRHPPPLTASRSEAAFCQKMAILLSIFGNFGNLTLINV